MKTSHILLALVTLLTLTSLVATDVMLKQEYAKIDWSNPYQNFERRAVPSVRHVVIESAPIAEIVVEKNPNSHVLLLPAMANSYRSRRQNDTLFVSFTMNYSGEGRNPRDNQYYELPTGLVLRMPDLQSISVTNGRLSLRPITTQSLAVSLQNSRLRTQQLVVQGSMTLRESQHSFAVLGDDRYQLLRAVVADSSGLQISNTQIETFEPVVAPTAEVQLQGQAVRWLTGGTTLP